MDKLEQAGDALCVVDGVHTGICETCGAARCAWGAVTEKTPTAKEWEAAQSRRVPGARPCGFCGVKGHNIRTCPAYLTRSR